ncbi:unnamed protein product [Leptosia nina]|uniref:Uncharacterized protein n=1 Tax=Leptosia nina TaxID=320188 RepID=A0AAV1K1Q0_9NEOP
MSSLIGFRADRGFPPPRGLITAASRYVTSVIQKNPPVPLPRVDAARRRPARASIFIKTQRSTAAVPFVPAAAPRRPHPSSPSRFLRDVGAATRWGRRPRERKILTIGKSRVVSQSSVETEGPRVSVLWRDFGACRASSACGPGGSPVYFSTPPGVLPVPNKW